MAHYMPWFEAAPDKGSWGWHWTMNHFRPEHQVNGRRDAASHYYPLIGLYDSDDPDLLECQALLMKFAGIDGVIVDWYGTDAVLDYGLIHRNVQRLIPILERAGLHFAVCYEDQSVPKLIASHTLSENEAVAHGQRLLQWLQKNWFASPAYLRLDTCPVLLVFGGGYYQEAQWRQIFASLPQSPEFFTELGRRAPAIGGFGWPVPNGGTKQSGAELESFYTRAKDWPQFIPAAYPRFDDIYHEAGVGNSWGHIDDQDGKTYTRTLEKALQSNASIVQLVTWNDWGEGTMIEPSVEFGYRDLETTQRLRRKYMDPAFPYTAQDLRLPVQLYLLKKRFRDDPTRRAQLASVSALLVAGRLERARKMLKEITTTQGNPIGVYSIQAVTRGHQLCDERLPNPLLSGTRIAR
jgi:hypothetical protein